ncbi:UDP-N-acetylmuramoyl-L-alanine--D-glutamate ligase [soil metagenome]
MKYSLVGERIGVLGLARSGLAAARLALARGAEVYASDAGNSEAAAEAAEQIRRLGGQAETGRHDVEQLSACDRIVLSPGIPPTAAILREPALRSIPIIAEVELACEQLTSSIIGITGTNGKTTVTSILAHILSEGGVHAVAAGNIGNAVSDLALADPQPEVVVLEVSSFQLGSMERFAPEMGILTNLAPDHLDRYPSVEAYYADKARLFRNATGQSVWILNGEDAAARELPGDAPGQRYYFRIESTLPADERGGYLTGDGWLVLRTDGGDEKLLHRDELKILGPHNIANALAAAIAARLQGMSAATIAEALRSFRALDHRMEPVGEVDGVLWVNDSKATNIASTRVAIRSLDRPVVLLLGGRHKGEPYTELLRDVRERVRCVIAFGEAAARVEQDLSPQASVARVDGDFEAVVRRAREIARPGDAVLLSPACSSYDMFSDYQERGNRFRTLVTGETR